jgi:hypothetical protein
MQGGGTNGQWTPEQAAQWQASTMEKVVDGAHLQQA